MTTQHLFAPNHDNTAGLAALHTLQAPLFDLYRLDVLTEWHGEQEQVFDANLATVRVGLPSVVILLQAISDAERLLLRSTYFAGTALDGDITVQTLNKDLGVYQRFNGVARDPVGEWYLGGWKDVRWVIDQLELISGFSGGFSPTAFGG